MSPEGTKSVFASGFDKPNDIVVDCQGRLFVTNYDNGTISMVTAQGVASAFYNTGLMNVAGIDQETFTSLAEVA